MTCRDCAAALPTDQTIRGEETDMRIHTCACGSRWMSEQRITRRLLGTHKGGANGVQGPPRDGTNPRPTARGVGGAPSSGTDLGQTSLAPSEPLSKTRPRVERPSVQETAAFIAFYEAYPRKKQRPAALRAWVKQGCEAIADAVMAGLRAHLPELNAREPDKVPYPASWINDTEWKDPPLPMRAADTRCHFHRSPGTTGKRPPAGWFSACPECKHGRAGGGSRTGEASPVADLVAATEAKLAAQRNIKPASPEQIAELRASREAR